MPTKLQIERWGPLIVGCAMALVWIIADGEITAFFAKELLAALLSSAAIAAGFLATALSILLPLSSTPTGKMLRKGGYLPHLYLYLRRAIFSCLGLALLSVIGFFWVSEKAGPPQWLSTGIIFSSAYTAAALVRIAEVLMNLFERAQEPEDKDG